MAVLEGHAFARRLRKIASWAMWDLGSLLMTPHSLRAGFCSFLQAGLVVHGRASRVDSAMRRTAVSSSSVTVRGTFVVGIRGRYCFAIDSPSGLQIAALGFGKVAGMRLGCSLRTLPWGVPASLIEASRGEVATLFFLVCACTPRPNVQLLCRIVDRFVACSACAQHAVLTVALRARRAHLL